MVSIAVVVATIPPREADRQRLHHQIEGQTRKPDEVVFWGDGLGLGAAQTRNLAIEKAQTEFVAIFDDDDVMYPRHIELLERFQQEFNADLVYPWHDLIPEQPNPLNIAGEPVEGRKFDDVAKDWLLNKGNFIPCAVLVRRSLMLEIGGFRDFQLQEWDPAYCELADCWRRLLQAGAEFVHCPYRTWAIVRRADNTAGLNWHEHMGVRQEGYDA